MTTHLEFAQDLALLLGPRQADIMRLLWTHGPATVRDIHTWLLPDALIAYTTVMNICVTLTKKGLLERRRVAAADQRPHAGKANVYVPLLSEAEFVRQAIGQRIAPVQAQYPAIVQAQLTGIPTLSRCGSSDRARVEHVLAYLGTLCDPLGQAVDITMLDTITGLLERAEAAERTAATRETEIQAAERRIAAAEQHAARPPLRAAESEQLAARLEANNAPPRFVPTYRTPLEVIYDYRDAAGICRVCGCPAPPQLVARQDDLRVCREERCRIEGRRRDSVLKQRRVRERRRALNMQSDVNSASATPNM